MTHRQHRRRNKQRSHRKACHYLRQIRKALFEAFFKEYR